MKKLSLLAAAGMMALLLSACGEQSPKPEAQPDTATTEQAAQQPVVEEATPAPASTEATTPATNTDGATTQE